MIDHVNFQVPEVIVHTQDMTEFMTMLGLREVPPQELGDDQYVVRWWEDDRGMRVHVVGRGSEILTMGYGHLCVRLPLAAWQQCKDSTWCIRANPTSLLNRVWLYGPGGIRAEVQSYV